MNEVYYILVIFFIISTITILNYLRFHSIIHKKLQAEPVPFGWSKKQFLAWLYQEPYRRTAKRCTMDLIYSIIVGSVGGWSFIMAITDNILYLILTIPAIIHLTFLRKIFKKKKER